MGTELTKGTTEEQRLSVAERWLTILQRYGKMYAASNLVPESYRDNIADCAVAYKMAMTLGRDPVQIMQSLYLIGGRPSWSASFLIDAVRQSKDFDALRYEFSGTEGNDDWGCTASATERATGELLKGTTITIAMAKAEGWYGKKGSKWVTMPEQMLRYRAAAFWVRVYAPGILLVSETAEEAQDSGGAPASEIIAAEIVPAVAVEPEAVEEPPAQEEATPDLVRDVFRESIEMEINGARHDGDVDQAFRRLTGLAVNEEEQKVLEFACDQASKKFHRDVQKFDAAGNPM